MADKPERALLVEQLQCTIKRPKQHPHLQQRILVLLARAGLHLVQLHHGLELSLALLLFPGAFFVPLICSLLLIRLLLLAGRRGRHTEREADPTAKLRA